MTIHNIKANLNLLKLFLIDFFIIFGSPALRERRSKKNRREKTKERIDSFIKELNERQNKFCYEYMKDFNATRAFIQAGYSAKQAHKQVPRMFKVPRVMKFLEYLKSKDAELTKATIIVGVSSSVTNITSHSGSFGIVLLHTNSIFLSERFGIVFLFINSMFLTDSMDWCSFFLITFPSIEILIHDILFLVLHSEFKILIPLNIALN